MQIILNRAPVREYIAIRSIISIYGKPVVLSFCEGVFFKTVTPVDIVLQNPPVKIRNSTCR